jgi:hypothetical protein
MQKRLTVAASIQIPYLMSLALLLTEFLPEYPPDPRSTFRILTKLDAAFASLIQGRNIETGESLPGAERGKLVTTTELVRLKSLVDQTRLVVVKALKETDLDDDNDDDDIRMSEITDETDDDDLDRRDEDDVTDVSRQEMGITRVYDKTIVELGILLTLSPGAGIISDD